MDLEATLGSIEPGARPSPIRGFEFVRGWGIYAHPFDSGHVLALRVFPENDFAPYKTIWHRPPGGEWTIYVDGPRLDTACPRYYGAAVGDSRFASIDLAWTGPLDLTVAMDDPGLVWSVSMAASPVLDLVNAVSRTVPEALVRTRPMTRAMEWVGDAVFDLGSIDLAGVVPNGQEAILLPRQLFPIESASAHFDGATLGAPARHPENPTIGTLRLPARPVLAIGGGYFAIEDAAEHDSTIAELHDPAMANDA